jgi:hypothetical protein
MTKPNKVISIIDTPLRRHAYDPFAVWAARPKQPYRTFPKIAKTFAPYDKMAGFQRGHEDYMDGKHTCPFDDDSVQAQAWYRGHMAAALFTQQEPAHTERVSETAPRKRP